MTLKERQSCISTINLLRRLAFNVHGVIDVIDNENCDKLIALLDGGIEEIEGLKRVNKVLQERVIFLENNKPCKDCASNPISEYSILENESKFWKERIEKIEQIINTAKAYRPTLDSQDIQAICEVLEDD